LWEIIIASFGSDLEGRFLVVIFLQGRRYKIMKMNLQYFAEPAPTDPPKEPEKLEFTQEELDAKINSEYDRRMQ